jgi:hypothetical protein
MSTCGETKDDVGTCTLETIEIDGKMTHYGPSHVDETTNSGWFDESLPDEPPPPVLEPPEPGVL